MTGPTVVPGDVPVAARGRPAGTQIPIAGRPAAVAALLTGGLGGLVAAGALEWVGDFAAAAAVCIAVALVACALGPVQALGRGRELLTPLAAIATAKAALLATPLPLLTPASRLGVQAVLVWTVTILARRAELPLPADYKRGQAALRRIGRIGRLGAEQLGAGMLAVAAGIVVGAVAAAVVPYHQLVRGTGPGLVAELVVVAAGLAVPEELLFRGLLTPVLGRLTGTGAPVIDATVFAAAYGGAGSAGLLVIVAASGLVAAAVRLRTGSVWLPALAHAAAAATAVLLAPGLT
ncbi:MAG TPA: CPBP family intramembrane glutamic endopeptidase [Acidimicrobiales bacterium]|nr:CPBP family intramembrane glutamic endopeptidase [Acidimicrobiales bacterium]